MQKFTAVFPSVPHLDSGSAQSTHLFPQEPGASGWQDPVAAPFYKVCAQGGVGGRCVSLHSSSTLEKVLVVTCVCFGTHAG